MKAKENLNIEDLTVCEEFWYALDNGYLNPNDILDSEEDIKKVNEAISIINKFESICCDLDIFQ